MITSKQREEAGCEEYARVSILRKVWTFLDGFKLGAIWAEKTILEMASADFDEWLRDVRTTNKALSGTGVEIWQAATLASEKRHAKYVQDSAECLKIYMEKVKELEEEKVILNKQIDQLEAKLAEMDKSAREHIEYRMSVTRKSNELLDETEAKLTLATEQNDIMKKALEFYAKTETWRANGWVCSTDLWEPWSKQGIGVGGKRAKEAIDAIKEKS